MAIVTHTEGLSPAVNTTGQGRMGLDKNSEHGGRLYRVF